MEIVRYVLVSPDEVEGDYEYDRYDEAVREAGRLGHAVIARTYSYDDSELVWTPERSV